MGFGLKYSRLSREEKQERVRWALEQMGFSYEEIKDQSPLSLSGGEKRRVAIAGVLATKPELLMLDEPLAGLDPMAREMFLEFLEGLTGQGVSVVMVSHNVDALAQHAARIIGMKQGKIVMDGSCQEVLGDSRALRTIGLLGSEAAQTAELYGQTVCCRRGGKAERFTPALQEEMENVPVEEKRILPGSGLPVTYEALRDEIIGALTGEKEKTDDADADGAVSPRKYIFSSGRCERKAAGAVPGDCSGDRVQRADWLYRRGGSGADGIVFGRDIPAGADKTTKRDVSVFSSDLLMNAFLQRGALHLELVDFPAEPGGNPAGGDGGRSPGIDF